MRKIALGFFLLLGSLQLKGSKQLKKEEVIILNPLLIKPARTNGLVNLVSSFHH